MSKIIKDVITQKQEERIDEIFELLPKLKGLGSKILGKGATTADDAFKVGEKEADQLLGPTGKAGAADDAAKGSKSGAKAADDVRAKTNGGAAAGRVAKGGGAGGALALAGAASALSGSGAGMAPSSSDSRSSKVPVKTSASSARKRAYHEEWTPNSAPTPKKREDDPGILRPKDSQKKPTTLSRKTQILRQIIDEERSLKMASLDMRKAITKQYGLQSIPQDIHGNPMNWLRYTDSGSPYENLKTHVELGGKRFEKLETAIRYFKNAGKNLISAGKEKLKEETKGNAIKKAIEDERKKRLSLQNPWIEVNPKIKTDSKTTDNISIDLYN